MVKFHEIPLYRLRPYIKMAFEGDADLIDRYHLVNGDLMQCVYSTYDKIMELGRIGGELSCYALFQEEFGPIGYMVTTPENMLYSFGINIEYRTAAIVMDWWQQVKKMLNNEFAVPLWKKNERAINFFLRNGMEIGYEGADHITLIYY